jgi:DivIVA domain-containing protein
MMDLTPLDVRKKKADFARALRGYEPSAVDGFLDLVADRMDELVRENASLRDRAAQLGESLEAFRQRESALNDALVTAQQLREEMRAQTQRDSELTLREARMEGERVIADARREAIAVAESLRRLQIARARFLRGFRGYLERQLEEVRVEEARAVLRSAPSPTSEPDGPAGAEGSAAPRQGG